MALGLIILVWGARTNRRWVVPVTAVLALPIVRVVPSMLVACIPLARRTVPKRARPHVGEPDVAAAADGNRSNDGQAQDRTPGTATTAPGPS